MVCGRQPRVQSRMKRLRKQLRSNATNLLDVVVVVGDRFGGAKTYNLGLFFFENHIMNSNIFFKEIILNDNFYIFLQVMERNVQRTIKESHINKIKLGPVLTAYVLECNIRF